jgi:riboflavin synthase
MFTGIVAAVGRVAESGPHLVVDEPTTAAQLQVGGSVAVNGVCLTVVRKGVATFAAEVVPETLRRSNLGGLGAGDPVNLELPLRLTDGLGGHLVQGHVDTTTEVIEVRAAQLGREVRFVLPPELAPYVAEKGSIAIDGTSLTVAGVQDASFTVALIPHTLARTVAGGYAPGTLVNVEVDVVARYVERLLRWRSG